MHTPIAPVLHCLLFASFTIGCHGHEAATVDLPVVAQSRSLDAVTSADGARIELSAVRVAYQNLTMYAPHAPLHSLRRASARPDPAHPGHDGHEVRGELAGDFVAHFGRDGLPLGTATLIVGTYGSAEIGVGRASAGVLDEGDPLIGHSAEITGVVTTTDGAAYPFVALLDLPAETQLVDIPFEATIQEGEETRLELLFLPGAGAPLFDGIDFAAFADPHGEVEITPGNAAHDSMAAALAAGGHLVLQIQPRL